MKEINARVRYIGADDDSLDLFESQYAVPEGMAYNSYVVFGGKTAVLDTVDARAGDQWKNNLEEALEGRKPDYLVVHHLEPDHSALIAWAAERWPEMKIVASSRAIAMLPQFFDGQSFDGRTIAVKDGDTLDLGGATLQFFLAPMVHWPEVAVSYLKEDGILFSADAFGKFGSLGKCGFWGDEDGDWACEGRRYYFNICGKYGGPVQALLNKTAPLDIRTICPLHGPVLRQGLDYYLDLYRTWSSYGVETPGVFVAYASIHGGTREVAEILAEILKAKGAPKVALSDLSRDDPAEAVEDAFRYGKMVLAVASYDGGLFPPASEFIHHLLDKAWQKRRVGLVENGSWAPSAGRVMKELFSRMKDVEIVEPLVTIRSRFKEGDRAALEALADAILS